MKKFNKVLLIGAVASLPIAAFAAIDTTHHDMTQYGSNEKCAYCHSKNLATPTPDPGSVVPPPEYGKVGVFCALVCHDGTLTQATVAAPSYLPANSTTFAPVAAGSLVSADFKALGTSHTLGKAINLVGQGNLDTVATVEATGWPHVRETEMQCTSCHSVHDSTNPPFLNAPLSAATGNADSFCQKCHSGAGAAGTAGRYQTMATRGAHPTEFVLGAPTGGIFGVAYLDAANGGPVAGKAGRTIKFKGALLGVTPAAGFATNYAGSTWNMGGHFMTSGGLPVAAGATAKFGCYSCHSAHQGDAGPAGAALQDKLTLGIADNGAGTIIESTICVACHGDDTRTSAESIAMGYNDPGDTGYSHPTNRLSGTPYQHDHSDHGAVTGNSNVPTTGSFPLDVPASLVATVGAANVGQGGQVLCNACHDVHGGMSNRMALRTIGAAANYCNNCHNGTTVTTMPAFNSHHPYGSAADVTGYADPAWGATLADGLDCADCHRFGTTAHNW